MHTARSHRITTDRRTVSHARAGHRPHRARRRRRSTFGYDGPDVPGSSDPASSDRRPVCRAGALQAAEAARIAAHGAPVDAVGLEERAAAAWRRVRSRSESKLWALDLAIRCMDLTTLEGTDTVGKIVALCSKAVRPDPLDPSSPVGRRRVPLPAARAGRASSSSRGTGVQVASVAGAFPAGSARSTARLREIGEVAELGADEIDIVLNRSLFLGGRVRAGVRRARGRARGGRRRAPQGDPGDRRAGLLRPRAAGVDAGDGGGRGLHQDVDRQDRRPAPRCRPRSA